MEGRNQSKGEWRKAIGAKTARHKLNLHNKFKGSKLEKVCACRADYEAADGGRLVSGTEVTVLGEEVNFTLGTVASSISTDSKWFQEKGVIPQPTERGAYGADYR